MGVSDPVETWLLAEASFLECSKANCKANENIIKVSVPTPQWTPSPFGSIKINCDVPFDAGSSLASTAAIFRNDQCLIIGGATKSFQASSVSMERAVAVRLGLFYTLNEGLSNIIVESDNPGLISRLHSIFFFFMGLCLH